MLVNPTFDDRYNHTPLQTGVFINSHSGIHIGDTLQVPLDRDQLFPPLWRYYPAAGLCSYGISDNVSQVLKYYEMPIRDQDREYFIAVEFVSKRDISRVLDKSGPYIGLRQKLTSDDILLFDLILLHDKS